MADLPVVTIAANAVKARIIEDDRDVKLMVSEMLSYFVAGAEQSASFKAGRWDGRSSLFEWKTRTFPAGFVPSVSTTISNMGRRVRLVRKPLPASLGPSVEDSYLQVQPFGYDPRYDYQLETVRRLERHGQIIAQLATGAGKSIVARTAVRRIMRPAIFITTRKLLMRQMEDGFAEAGFKVGVLGDSEWRPSKGVNVAMVQTLHAKLKDERALKLLQLFELAILEEAHEAGGEGYYDVMSAMPNAHYRLALTATPFMRPDAEANMRLMAVSGQIGIKVSEKTLIDRGILARPVFKFLALPPPPALRKGHSWQKAYEVGIVANEIRNRAIVGEAGRAAKHGLSAMILVQRQKHGDALLAMCRAAGLRADFIFGEHDGDRRARALGKLKTGDLDVLIGSTILDVGVDVPAVGMVILAGAGKAEVALRQRIGRGLRAKKSGPNLCLVVDFMDVGNGYLSDHARERRRIIETTEGFAENILPAGQDFDWSVFVHC